MMTGRTSTRAVIASLRLERNGIMAPATTAMATSAARIPQAILLMLPPLSRGAIRRDACRWRPDVRSTRRVPSMLGPTAVPRAPALEGVGEGRGG